MQPRRTPLYGRLFLVPDCVVAVTYFRCSGRVAAEGNVSPGLSIVKRHTNHNLSDRGRGRPERSALYPRCCSESVVPGLATPPLPPPACPDEK
jgi:hypothetical protein